MPSVDGRILEIAKNTLTAKQYRAFELVHVHGMKLRQAALYDREHRTTMVDRYDAACLNLERAGVKINASNVPYLEETA
jgi:hypothetical protein